ncbi:unnamed protein product, partial [Brachionus calyciflorus]
MVNQNQRPTSPPINSSINTSSSSSSTTQNNNNNNTTHHNSILFSQNSKLFCDNFWGDRANGFDVLCQNLKHQLTSAKDLETYLRESLNTEDQYARSLNKLVSVINKFSSNGSFNPLWSLLRDLNEKYSTSHSTLGQTLQDLIKDVQKYAEDLSKKVKRIRENEQQTQIIVQNYQESQNILNKSRDQYHNICCEFDKLKRQLDHGQLAQYQQMSQQQQVSASNLLNLVPGSLNSNNLNSTLTTNKVSQLIKLEKKMKLSCDDYKSSIEKYNNIRLDYERKLIDSCNQFQYAEEMHLKQMRNYIETYSRIISVINSQKSQIMNEFNMKLENYTCEYLLGLFVENKRTGQERPDVAQFVESPINTPNVTANNNNNNDNDFVLNENEFKNFFQTSYSQLNSEKTQSPVQNNNDSKNKDSKGLNIFNVDFLTGRNKNKKTQNKSNQQTKISNSKLSTQAKQIPNATTIPQNNNLEELTKTNNIEDKSINSLSLDLLDHLKISDVDSEGYSLRPDSSIDLRRKTNDDMNNYVSSSSSSSSSSSDSDSDTDDQPVKINLKINPKKDHVDKSENVEALKEISKNLILQKPPAKTAKTKTYYYNYEPNMTRSISVGSNLQSDSLNKTNESSLFELDFSPKPKIQNENSLYNIDEDKEVESSFQYNLSIKKPTVSSSPAGRFTPACFPGRTTPDFRHTTSFFEQQGTRASIVSPLTINSGIDIIPIAVNFNETIHAYFKIGDASKFKIKCFGCMKISFPFAILKLLSLELPNLEFNLKNLHILNADLKLNSLLLENLESNSFVLNEFNFKFRTHNLISELKSQHQLNKQAAFFNFELLKYEFKYGLDEAPLVLAANWSCNYEEQTIELILDYKFNYTKSLSQCNFMILMPMVSKSNGKDYRISLDKSEPNA